MSENAPTETFDKAQAPSFSEASILIVDEDPAFQLGLKTFLKEYAGFAETFTANNGLEALDLLEKEPSISMVTLDYKMPDMDGVEFLETLKGKLPHPLAVIMITGYPSEELEETFRAFHSTELRAEEFVPKPVEFTALEAILHRSWQNLQVTLEPGKDESSELPQENPEAMIDWRLIQIEQKLDQLSSDVTAVGKRVPGRTSRFFSGVFKALIALGLFWLAMQLGWLDKAAEAIDNIELPAPSTQAAPEKSDDL